MFNGLWFERRGTEYLNVEAWLLFAPPIKIYGCAPAPESLSLGAFMFVQGG